MEWVETTGRSIEEAKERALDELGVDESEAEFEVLEDARSGLFGRLRSEARVRARVRPTAPRAKEDRRDRRRRNRSGERTSTTTDGGGTRGTTGAPAAGSPDAQPSTSQGAERGSAAVAAVDAAGPGRSRPARNRSGRGRADGANGTSERNRDERGEGNNVEVPLEEQGRVAEEFLTQLTGEFGLHAEVTVERPDEDTVDLQLRGSDLGLLIGQKGSTLLAIQDLTRTVVHHKTGAGNGRIHVDVGGYRQKRMEALARFAEQVAATVRQSGTRTVLEPMSAADRKVVHDAITNIEGVTTISEGEDPRRRVVVLPIES